MTTEAGRYPIAGTALSGSLPEAILACVAAIPAGRVMTYGDVAEFVGSRAARMVGRVLAMSDDEPGLPWHRVVRADGRTAEHLRVEQLQRLRSEGVPITGDRIDLRAARWDGRLTVDPR